MNKVILHGRLTRDPEVKTTQTGRMVCQMGIAVDRPGKEKAADFLNLVAWEKSADFAGKYLHKGSELLVEGRLSTRSYENAQGQKRTVTEVIVDRMEFCGSKATAKPAETFGGMPVTEEEDVPF